MQCSGHSGSSLALTCALHTLLLSTGQLQLSAVLPTAIRLVLWLPCSELAASRAQDAGDEGRLVRAAAAHQRGAGAGWHERLQGKLEGAAHAHKAAGCCRVQLEGCSGQEQGRGCTAQAHPAGGRALTGIGCNLDNTRV